MKCAIMQPTYLPWAGYFNLIAEVDIFVFLDDVQFETRSWQSRNRMLVNGKSHWITVPVINAGRSQIINTVKVDDTQKWREKHVNMLHHAYARHQFKSELVDVMSIIIDKGLDKLADLNITIIRNIAAKMGLNPLFVRASDLNLGGKRSEHLLTICRNLKCDEYLSPVGSADYLIEDGVFDQSGITVSFQNFIPEEYVQMEANDFVSHLSIVDIVANMGWSDAIKYIRNGVSRHERY